MPRRRLSLIRHAKAGAGASGGGGDYERPLSLHGERDASTMADYLRGLDFDPDRIFSSTARRAMQTSEGLTVGLGQDSSVIVRRDELYLAEPAELLRCVRETDPVIQHLVVVGHNPGLAGFWGWLTGAAISNLPTCGVVLLDLGVENWIDVDAATAALIDFVCPATVGSRNG